MVSAGRIFIAFTSAMVSFSVPATSGLASLLKPIWVSLICRNRGRPAGFSVAACANPIGVRMPPDSVKSVPAPPKARHCKAPRREGLNSSVTWDLEAGFEAYTGKVDDLFPALTLFYQGHESIELRRIDIGHRRHIQIILFPENHAIAVTRARAWKARIAVGPGEQIDDMCAMTIDHHGGS